MTAWRDYTTVEITDTDYYYMIENQIRAEMPKFEVGVLLPRAISLLKCFNIKDEELTNYPIDGYYYKSEALKHFFTIIRNLQHTKAVCDKISPLNIDLQFLQRKCDHDIYGEAKPYTSGQFQGLIKRRYDVLTLALEDEKEFNLNTPRPWSIGLIQAVVNKHIAGRVNLVELAALTQNPACLCCGAETNSLYRMHAWISGCLIQTPIYTWKVSSYMERLGGELIEAYNALIGSNMVKPTLYNHTTLNKEPEQPRVAHLGFVDATKENYYWILQDGVLSDKYSTAEITTEMLKNE